MATAGDENAQLNHAPPALQDATTTKRQRVLDAKTSLQAASRVFDVEMLLRGLLTLLDVASLASFLEVLALDETWQGVLTNENLWKEMTDEHFGGSLPPIEQFNDDENVVEEEEEDDDELPMHLPFEFEDEDEDEDEEEEEAPDLLERLEGDMEVEDVVNLVEDEDEDSDQEVVLVPRPRAVRSARQIAAERAAEPAVDTRVVASLQWVAGVPSQKLLEAACPDLKGFLRSAEQLVQFDQRVQIVRGDIGDIETVGDQRVDGLAFPTASFLRNPHTGAAAVIFRRAGQGLNDHVRTLDVRLDIGQAHVTPGFDAGVDKLIHCVGPSGFNPGCMRDLQRTYRSVLRCIQRENLSCVAMASISTGNMGVPVDNAAWYALCAIQRLMRSTDWTATLAIVCFEANVYDAFTKNKGKLLTQFNADIVRATPPLRQR